MHLWGLWTFLVFLAIAMLASMWYAGKASRRREKEILASRPYDTLEAFVASFRPDVQPIANAMYSQFQEFSFNKNFPFRKSDDVAKALNIDPMDISGAVIKLADQFGCRKPTKEDKIRLGASRTFEEYVEFINHLKARGAAQS